MKFQCPTAKQQLLIKVLEKNASTPSTLSRRLTVTGWKCDDRKGRKRPVIPPKHHSPPSHATPVDVSAIREYDFTLMPSAIDETHRVDDPVHMNANWTRRPSRECISPPSEFLQMPPFQKILRGHVRTVSGNMHVKSEVHSFNRFKLVWLTGPLHTYRQTDRQNHIERKQYLCHSLRSFRRDNNSFTFTLSEGLLSRWPSSEAVASVTDQLHSKL